MYITETYNIDDPGRKTFIFGQEGATAETSWPQNEFDLYDH